MLKGIKNIFNEETEVLDTQELEEVDASFDVDEIQSMSAKSKGKSVIKIYEPVTKTSTGTIIDSIKRGELCVVNFNKVSEEEARSIYATLSGSMYSLDGELKQIDDNIIICAPLNFLVDGELSD